MNIYTHITSCTATSKARIFCSTRQSVLFLKTNFINARYAGLTRFHDSKGVVKLSDFGCSKKTEMDGSVSESQHTAGMWNSTTTTFRMIRVTVFSNLDAILFSVGTMQFMAPEVKQCWLDPTARIDYSS